MSRAAAYRRGSCTWAAAARPTRWTCSPRSRSKSLSRTTRWTGWWARSARGPRPAASGTERSSSCPSPTRSACARAKGGTPPSSRSEQPTAGSVCRRRAKIIHSFQRRRNDHLAPLDAAQKVSELIKQNNIEMVDLKFNDLPGLWQHFSIPPRELHLDDPQTSIWVDGIGFDGSSIRGFQKIQESDMILIPDPHTAKMDPACAATTLSIICDIQDPLTHEPYSRDPRYIARKAEAHLKKTGIADSSFWGPELEFFVFDDIRFDQTENSGYYFVDSIEGEWNSGREENPNLGYKPRFKEGYFPAPPHDSLQDLRSEMVLTMEKLGITVEVHHHEVATAGQCEIDMRYDTLTNMADKVLWYKYIVKNVARKHNKVATFMPKPLFLTM